ncbi:MFS transporter [Rathayibacter soli]|uniref:MFS transporter n=1 Tax=Rathayibacter soli TaxID=3144168 RepID=UPI0027E50165|nr:MFS transporter [Glaciibacter superstes]
MSARSTTAILDRADRGLGPAFGRLWAAAIASNLADGIGRTAIPLIATTLTKDPLLISAVTAVAFVPWLLFGLPAGMLVDRVDRRRAMAVANGVRVAMALVVAVAITTGVLTIWLLYACILIWGMGETVFDTATNAVLPSTVRVTQLEPANGRIQAAQLVVDTFIGTPLSGALFALAIAVPVWSTAGGFAVSALLVLFLPLSVARAAAAPEEQQSQRHGVRRLAHEAVESLSFLWRHRLLRGLLVFTTLAGGLLAFGQASEILYLLYTMAVPPGLLGFVLAGVGVGALAGALTASRLVARFARGKVMLLATAFGGIGLGLVGLAPTLPLAIVSWAISAYAISVWNVPWSALRQQLIPQAMLGRTIGFIRSLTWGIIPVATILGGAVARIDLRLPFLIGGVGIVIVVLLGSKLLLSIDRRTRDYSSPASPNSSSNALGSDSAG